MNWTMNYRGVTTDMRILKALALLAGIALALLFVAAMANIGMDNMDEWYYDKGKDTGIAVQDTYTREI